MLEQIKTEIGEIEGEEVISASPCSGGCTASSYKVETPSKTYFVKTLGSRNDVFKKEANGLRELNKFNELIIPEVVFFDDQYLCLEWVNSSRPTNKCYQNFGKQLARLHRHQGHEVGFYEDNYIGKTKQINKKSSSWSAFFIDNRLNYQFNLLQKKNLSTSFIDRSFDQVIRQSESSLIVNEPTSSPLHGDLWGGNHLMNERDEMVLIDPAFYYGHREADLALMKMFGSFPDITFESYQNEWPLIDNFEKRIAIYQLYHAFNHINLEGHGYLSLAENIIREII
jgi:fructosamine-3-kinase